MKLSPLGKKASQSPNNNNDRSQTMINFNNSTINNSSQMNSTLFVGNGYMLVQTGAPNAHANIDSYRHLNKSELRQQS